MAKEKGANENLRFYEQLRRVPEEAKKPIMAGRLKGMSDINPVFRVKTMTETFGPCGIGWKYVVTKQWQEAFGQEVKAFTNIDLFIKVDGEWSDAIPGTGGATLVEVNKSGFYVNDEGFKMSLTDALSVAMKSLGVAADVYYSRDAVSSDNKYAQNYVQSSQTETPANTQTAQQMAISQDILNEVNACQTTTDLQFVWNKYTSLWPNAQFTGAVTARKDQILKNGKS